MRELVSGFDGVIVLVLFFIPENKVIAGKGRGEWYQVKKIPEEHYRFRLD